MAVPLRGGYGLTIKIFFFFLLFFYLLVPTAIKL